MTTLQTTELSTYELRIDGMDCAECALHVEEQINKVSGVSQAKVLLAAEKGIVTFDAGLASVEDIKTAVAAAGYQARDLDAEASAPEPLPSRLFAIVRLLFVGGVGLLAFIQLIAKWMGWLPATTELLPPLLALSAALLGGYPIFKSALVGLRTRSINADLLMSVGIVAALSIGEFVSAVLLVLFLLIAHFLEGFTTDKARSAIRKLVALTPKEARILRDGVEVEVAANELRPGDMVIVRPGEYVPADGVVVDGRSAINQAPITGESIPVEKGQGDDVFAATLNELGVLHIEVSKVGADTTLGKIIRLVEEAESAKAPVQRFADRFTAWFLPIVIAAALLTYLISGNLVFTIAVLVVACPCAVALATPLAVVASVGSAARRGLLIKGGLYLEALAKVDTVLVDKTGTLTFGKPVVTDVVSDQFSVGSDQFSVGSDQFSVGSNQFSVRGGLITDNRLPNTDHLLRLAAGLERYSEHPLAAAILAEAAQRSLPLPQPADFVVVPGKGVTGMINGRFALLGNRPLLAANGVTIPAQLEEQAAELERAGKTVVFLAEDSQTLGIMAVADLVRDEVPAAIKLLKQMGIRHLIMLTGDNERTATAVAHELGIACRAELLPEDKIGVVRALQAEGRRVAMVGDGINDAPALTQADVGIAMGVAGTDVALEAADVALMRDDWSQIPEAILIGRRAFRTIKQNITFGIIFNVFGIGLASVGILTPVMAAAAESLPDVAVFLNSSRLLRAGK